MSAPARGTPRRGGPRLHPRDAVSLLLTLTSAASCGVIGPSPPSVLGPVPDLPSADDGGVDVPPIFGTGGASGSGGSPGGCLPEPAHNECVGNELWQVSNPTGCAEVSSLIEVCSAGCVTSPLGVGSCAGDPTGIGGFGGFGGHGGAAGATAGP